MVRCLFEKDNVLIEAADVPAMLRQVVDYLVCVEWHPEFVEWFDENETTGLIVIYSNSVVAMDARDCQIASVGRV